MNNECTSNKSSSTTLISWSDPTPFSWLNQLYFPNSFNQLTERGTDALSVQLHRTRLLLASRCRRLELCPELSQKEFRHNFWPNSLQQNQFLIKRGANDSKWRLTTRLFEKLLLIVRQFQLFSGLLFRRQYLHRIWKQSG